MKGKENVNDGNIGQQKVKKFSVIPLYSIQGNGSKATITPLLRQKPAVLRTPLDTLAADTARRSMYTIDHTQPCKVSHVIHSIRKKFEFCTGASAQD